MSMIQSEYADYRLWTRDSSKTGDGWVGRAEPWRMAQRRATWNLRSEGEKERTIRLNPVTPAKEVAMEAPARGSSPRWPTNMREMTVRENCRKLDSTKGTARRNCLFTSTRTSDFLLPPPSPPWLLPENGIRGAFMAALLPSMTGLRRDRHNKDTH